MKIETVKLQNIRSHTDSVVDFTKGFNCLVGGVGSGKSSILYAIDFAFFGNPLSGNYAYLLREGASNGKVSVTFTHNGKKYVIERAIKKKGKNIGQDLEQLKLYEDGEVVAEGKNEAVAEQLKAITGLERDLFREIIWVRQEHLKELLDTTPRERQTRLDELIGISEYETAWSALLTIQKEYETEKNIYEKDYDVAGIERLKSEYTKATEEFAKLEERLHTVRREIVEREVQLKEAETLLQNLEQQRKQTEQLQRRAAQLKAAIESNNEYITRLETQIQRNSKRSQELRDRLKTYEEQTEALRRQLSSMEVEPNQTPEELKTLIDSLEDQIRDVIAESETIKRETKTAQQRFEQIAQESKCPLCLQNLSEDYKKDLQEKLTTEKQEKQKTLAELAEKRETLENKHKAIYAIHAEIQRLTPNIDSLKTQITDTEESTKTLQNEIENKQHEIQSQTIQLEQTQTEISKFDTAALETARKQKDTILQAYLPLKKEVEITEQRKMDIAAKIDDLKKRIEEAEQKKTRMTKIAKILDAAGSIREAYRAIQPKLRTEIVKILEKNIQRILDQLAGEEPNLTVTIDENYTPRIRSEGGFERDASNLSGGERTLIAFAYRLGLGQLITKSRTGQSLHMLLLDEPTESLGTEDGSINRLAEAISRIKTIEQIIAVTHSEDFAEKAEHIIRVEKEEDKSRVNMDKQTQDNTGKALNA